MKEQHEQHEAKNVSDKSNTWRSSIEVLCLELEAEAEKSDEAAETEWDDYSHQYGRLVGASEAKKDAAARLRWLLDPCGTANAQ